VVWDLRAVAPGGGGGSGGRGGAAGTVVAPGAYTVRITVGSQTQTATVTVR
jgi:hypothetical protein